MNCRETVGFTLVVAGLLLVPAAWAFSRVLWLVAFLLLVVGSGLFYSARMLKREEILEKESGGSGGSERPMPSDIHDYTGWGSGSRSETMDDSIEVGDDGGD